MTQPGSPRSADIPRKREGNPQGWGQALTHGNEDTTLIANLQSPRECLALAKWVSAASHKSSLSSPSPSVTFPFNNKPWVLAKKKKVWPSEEMDATASMNQSLEVFIMWEQGEK